ncbi:MAG: exodeoxyribonuclease V subunit alpha [Thermomonas sp.]
MSGYHFRQDTVETQVPEWGALQQALHRWVLAHGGSSLLARTAAWASLADAHADAALSLSGMAAGRHGAPVLDDIDIDALRNQAMVGEACADEASDGDGGQPTAFVIDAQARFYLWRNFARERAIGRRLRERRLAPPLFARRADAADIDALFDAATPGDDSAQRAAVRQLSDQPFAVLTGGPGTGKTTTVLRMLLMAQRQRQQAGVPPARIAIAATTGKAAQRLLASLRSGQQAMQTRFATATDAAWHSLLEGLPTGDAQTLHRLLGYRPYDGRFSRNHESPLEADIVVVDEASMLDLSLLDALLAALPDQAQLLLVGDADQLTSIGTGSVLLDLVAAMQGSADLVRLQHGFRAQSPQLPALLAAVRMGDAAGFTASLDGVSTTWHQVATPAQLQLRLHDWAERLAALSPLREGRACDETDALKALDALASLQLLCALREGDFGAVHANAVIERELAQRWQRPIGATWYPGRAVMVVRNDYGAGLFNGDVGICLADADDDLQVWFETTSGADGARSARALAPASVPAHEGAFAITVHKSQGSEYGHVALLLPLEAQHRVLSRQLVYTGLSRARHGVELWSGQAALAEALATPVLRVGGLREHFLT